ncbi:MAG: phosphodiesterase [Candidatus Omnitrophica bacterium]|nr:phosphodiesterase [Candidatus Omnitrophota bacterium]MCM8816319.1 phosphodiesterase [Candidatus Omnitrophota bacterium]
MSALVVSDTHGSVAAWEKIKEYLKPNIVCIFHAGDIYYFGPRNPLPDGHAPGTLAYELNSLSIPLICSKGNCDSEVDQLVSNFPLCDPFAFTFLYKKKILVTHGHKFSDQEILNLAKQWKINIVINGHTHIAQLENKDGIVFLNPGSCALPKNFPGIGLISEDCVELFNLLDGSLVKKIDFSD